MKVSIQALGSLGDIVPQIRVAQVLQERGHTVTLMAPRDFAATIASYGVTPANPAPFSLAEWMAEAGERGTLAGPAAFFRDWRRMIAPLVAAVLDRSREAAADADILVSNLICATARAAAIEYRKPLVLTALQPVLTPSRHTPCAMVWRRGQARAFNRAGYASIDLAQALAATAVRGAARQRGVELPERLTDLARHLGGPLMRITSVPPPLLPRAPGDWGGHSFLTAYPKLPTPMTANAAKAKVEGQPIYISFGSMVPNQWPLLLAMLREALDQTGQRGLFAASLAAGPDFELGRHAVIGHTPHDALFPQCGAILHHGGAGTIDSALRAGRPQIIVPQILDQFWYGEQIASLGAGVTLHAKPTTASLVHAIRAATSTTMQARALALAPSAARDGALEIADLIEAEARSRGLNA